MKPMGPAIGAILPLAVGVALSPIPIVAVILMLFSPRARSMGPAFVAGWVLGVAVVAGIVLLLADPANLAADAAGPSTTTAIIKLLLGALLVLVGVRQWQRRPKEGEPLALPHWMRSIDQFSPQNIYCVAVGAYVWRR